MAIISTQHSAGTGTSYVSGPAVDPPAGGSPVVPSRRRELDGLRAVAVIVVIAHHLWTGRVSGGVDVFFVLSAFLLTLSFVGRADAGRPWSMSETIITRFRRLVPMLAVTILGVLLLARFLLTPTRWRPLLEEAIASITFQQNRFLAGMAIDYYAAEQAQAPVLQHFWSMAIQGQMFVVWPLLLGLVLLLHRLTGWSVRFWVLALFGTVGAFSFAYSVVSVEAAPVAAYFLTAPRLWEFAVGSLLAVLVTRITVPQPWATVLGWVGVLALIACGLLQPAPAHFPGWLSGWPVLAAVAVILAGTALAGGGRCGVGAVLDRRPLRWVSEHSFGLYLWHWPLLVMWLAVSDRPHAGLVDGVGIILVSVVLTLGTERLIDLVVGLWRAGRGRPVRSLAVMVFSAVMVLVPVALWEGAVTRQAAAVGAQSVEANPGARSLRPDYVPTEEVSAQPPRLRPAGTELREEWANLPTRCTADWRPAGMAGENCMEYVPDTTPTRTILAVGDSHSQQLMAAVQPVAEQQGWHVISVLLHRCRYAGQREDVAPVCNEVNAEAQRLALELRPDAVLTVASRTTDDGVPEHLEPGYLEGVRPLTEQGITVVAIRDNPRFTRSVPECVQRYGEADDRCAVRVTEAMAEVSPLEALRDEPGVVPIDLTPVLCPQDRCPGVIGHVYVYMDRQHLTRTYAESMADDFAEHWFAATGWQPTPAG